MAPSRPVNHHNQSSKRKFYAVRTGRKPGIYHTWSECQAQTKGFSKAEFKGFTTWEEAELFLGKTLKTNHGHSLVNHNSRLEIRREACGNSAYEGSKSSTIEECQGTLRVSKEGDLMFHETEEHFLLAYDGASKGNPGKAGAGALLQRLDGTVVCELAEGLGHATNNVAEYRGLIMGLRAALDKGVKRIRVQGDSNLVCQQVLGNYKVHNDNLKKLCEEAKYLFQKFSEFSICHVDREYNSAADALANVGVGLPETKFISCIPRGYAEEQGSKSSIIEECQGALRVSKQGDLMFHETEEHFLLAYDGASKGNPGKAGAGALLQRLDGTVVCELAEGLGHATNNVAEYRGLIMGLRAALDKGVKRIRVQGDSNLVCQQVLGNYKVNNDNLKKLCEEAKYLVQKFLEFSIRHVDRKYNSAADALANVGVGLPETKFVSRIP